MPHQLLGAKWMVERENEPSMGQAVRINEKDLGKNYGKMKTENTVGGGLLADEMGLGKTIQSIALMVHNRAPCDEAIKVLSTCFAFRMLIVSDDLDYCAKGIVAAMETRNRAKNVEEKEQTISSAYSSRE